MDDSPPSPLKGDRVVWYCQCFRSVIKARCAPVTVYDARRREKGHTI